MAPEQAAAEPGVDHRADIYALGAVAYELLTRRPPFTAPTAQMVLAAQVTQTPERVSAHRAAVPPALSELVMRCLEKRPADRWQSADEVRQTLELLATPSGGSIPAGLRAPAAARRRLRIAAWVAGALLFAAAAYGIVRWLRPAPSRPTLVVLPFENVGAPTDAYFADGISEEITTRLARVSELQVVARNSALRYRVSKLTAQAFGREMGADYVLDGTVRWVHAGAVNRVRITPALIRVSNAQEVWGQTYDAALSDVFELQSDISEQVAGALEVTLGGTERRALREGGTHDLQAYNSYVLGRYEWRKRTQAGLQDAARLFGDALARDSNYARAWSGLADAVGLFPSYQVTVYPRSEAYERAERAARRAIALDPRSAEAHASLGEILFNGNWAWAAAEQEFQTAIALDPDYATAHQWYGELLTSEGRLREAIAEGRRSVQLDPLAPVMANAYGIALYCAGRYEDAIAQFRRSIKLSPGYGGPYDGLVKAYVAEGKYADALASVRAQGGDSPPWVDTLVRGMADAAYRRQARATLDAHLPEIRSVAATNTTGAIVFALLGRPDDAFAALERMVRERSENVAYFLRSDPLLAPLHSDPRWPKLLAAMGSR
jgi:serine/threonine-protein kinase